MDNSLIKKLQEIRIFEDDLFTPPSKKDISQRRAEKEALLPKPTPEQIKRLKRCVRHD